LTLPLAGGVDEQCLLEVLRDADVIDNQAAFFVAINPIDPRNSLHQGMPVHGFIDVHGVQAGGVKTGQEHIPHDQQFQVIGGVLQPVADMLAPFFVSNMLLPVQRVTGRTGHDDLDRAFVVIRAIPVRAKFDDLIMQRHADASAHADDHALAFRGRGALFEVVDDIRGNLLQAVLTAHNGFFASPACEAFLPVGELFIFSDLFNPLIEDFLVLFRELDFRQAAFVIDRHGSAIFDCLLDVVHVHVIPKDRLGVSVSQFDGRTSKANERGVRQGVAHVAGKAVNEVILAAVGFIRDHHHIASVRQGRVDPAVLLREEFLNGGEDDSPRSNREQASQVLAAAGLHRGLA